MRTTIVSTHERPTASQKYVRKLAKTLFLFPIIVFLLNGCADSVEDGLPGSVSDASYYHLIGWKNNPQHGDDYSTNPQNCEACHGEDLKGGSSGISCISCHHSDYPESPDTCQACHGDYTDSAHGNTLYGVNRSGTGYTIGACTHCHDPSDANASKNELMLFAPMNPASQTDNFCFRCHTDSGSLQDGGIVNNDYSSTFGGASGDVESIFQAFDQLSYHNLNDVLNSAIGKWPFTFTEDSNACSACHNVHIARQNKENRGDPTYTAISMPSDHDNLYGDDFGERMSKYNVDWQSMYQAPYSAATPAYEPDDSISEPVDGWGSNMPNYVTFCLDCHADPIGGVAAIDWSAIGDKHGGGAASNGAHYSDVLSPYEDSKLGGYILSCTDCHEPHGSPNVFLIRQKVNNGEVAVETGWDNLCERCHDEFSHSPSPSAGPHDPLMAPGDCSPCHFDVPCTKCHYHGGAF